MKIRVMTYNIQHGNVQLAKEPYIDLTKMCDVIKKYNPDIVGLNEVRGEGPYEGYTAQAEEMAAYLGYHCYFGRSVYIHGDDPYGNAVLSRYPIVEASVIRIPDPVDTNIRRFEPRSICRCVIEVPAEGERTYFEGPHVPVAIYSSHFGLNEPEQEHAVSTALSVLRSEPLPFVLMGDFNMEPDNPNIQLLHSKLRSADVFLAGKKSQPSEDPRIKIDYIYTSQNVAITAADIPQVVASDHCPVWADLEL